MTRWLLVLGMLVGGAATGWVAGHAQDQSDPKTWEPMVITGNQKAPEFVDVTEWLNTSKPIKWSDLRGKVVVVHFFAFACINCTRNYPWYKAVTQEYGDKVAVIGIHTPELPQEKDVAKLKQKIKEAGLTYPIVVDNNHANWRAFNNQWWPSTLLIDKKGQGRYVWNGELAWKGARGETSMRQKIDELLAERP
ncbi:MAG TPA: redoxin domain-containing protein [Gemmatales bacterium]|nr:redoxin domain-containing protein [Gemmatales bacterium]HMP59051.1 redoxin domain-containing protein [Gemmatales bacterium]